MHAIEDMDVAATNLKARMRRIAAENRIPEASWRAELTAYRREEDHMVRKLVDNIRSLKREQHRLAYNPVSKALDKALSDALDAAEAGDLATVDHALCQLPEKWNELEELVESGYVGMSFWDESRRSETEALLRRLSTIKHRLGGKLRVDPQHDEAPSLEKRLEEAPAASEEVEAQKEQHQPEVSSDFTDSGGHGGDDSVSQYLVPVAPARLDGGKEDHTTGQSQVEEATTGGVTGCPKCHMCQQEPPYTV
jgi:hypothetical protein